MKKTMYGIILVFFSTCVSAAYTTSTVDDAMNAYKNKGYEAFIPMIIKNSPLEGDKQALAQGSGIKQLEAFYGAFEGYDYVHEVTLTARTKIVYLIMNYENGPVYFSATLYKKKNNYIVSSFNFHTEMKNVFPSEVAFK